jgi:hypothetical protein
MKKYEFTDETIVVAAGPYGVSGHYAVLQGSARATLGDGWNSFANLEQFWRCLGI